MNSHRCSDRFAEDENPRAPVTAAHARIVGLCIDLVGERSGIGTDLQVLDQALERLGRFRSSMKLSPTTAGPSTSSRTDPKLNVSAI